jgi:WD40 repeat protein
MDQNTNLENTLQPEKKEKSKKKLFLIIGGIFLLLLIIGAVIFFLLSNDEEDIPEEMDETSQVEEQEEQLEPVLKWSVTFEEAINNITISPDGTTIASGVGDTVFTNLLTDSSTVQLFPFDRTIESLDYSNNGEKLAIGLDLYGSRLINSEDGTVLEELDGGYNNYVSFSPDGQYIATGDRSGVVSIFDVNTGDITKTLEEDGAGWVRAISYNNLGTLLAVTHQDGTLNIWDIESEEIEKVLNLDGLIMEIKNPFRFSPDGGILAGVGKEEMLDVVQVWSVEDYEELLTIEVPDRIRDIAFSPDGSMLGISFQKSSAIYDIETGNLLYPVDQTFETSTSDWNVSIEFVSNDSFVIARYNGDLEYWEIDLNFRLEQHHLWHY